MPTCLSIGTFDGVHLGHQKIIRTLVRESRLRGCGSVAVYFPLPPKFFFSGEKTNSLLTLPAERESLLRKYGAGRVVRMPFDTKLAAMSAESFFDGVVLGKYRARGLVTGRDFALGKDRKGNAGFLEKRCAAAGIRYKTVHFAVHGGHKISSSLIRAFLHNGHVEEANKCLGRNYSASGKVVKGAGIGRTLGFPTANIAADPAKILPPGVYAAKAHLGGETFSAVLNIGRRPTIKSLGGRLLLEAHILDFDRLIYGRQLEVEFLKHLRSEKKFRSREHLKEQISSDIALARKYFRARENSRTRPAARA